MIALSLSLSLSLYIYIYMYDMYTYTHVYISHEAEATRWKSMVRRMTWRLTRRCDGRPRAASGEHDVQMVTCCTVLRG